jgi:hypothetical protein
MLTDQVIVNAQTGIDEWGNPILVDSAPVPGRIIGRSKSGGGTGGQQETDLPQSWSITIVFQKTNPVPDVSTVLKVNGIKYEIDSLTVHEDFEGMAFEATATIIQDGDPV